jgi:hypothetical protein
MSISIPVTFKCDGITSAVPDVNVTRCGKERTEAVLVSTDAPGFFQSLIMPPTGWTNAVRGACFARRAP